MGYRSTVRISTTEGGFGALKLALWRRNGLEGVQYPLVGIDWSGRETGFDYIKHAPNGVIAGFDEVKWYDTYDSVRAFEHALEDLEEHDILWCFVRVGEDYDDIECRSGADAYDADMPHVYAEASINWW